MANLYYRFTLSHNSTSQQISEPIGWRDITLVLERDPEYHSLIEFFESPLQFYGDNGEHDGGRDFIENIINNVGVDETVGILIEASENNASFETLFEGILQLEQAKILDSRTLQCPIVRNDFWVSFKNREETPVDIQSTTDLDENTVDPIESVTVELPSQIVNKRTEYTGHSGDQNTIAEVSAATTANITLSGLQTIDGISLQVGQRALVKDQSSQSDNGVYVVSTGAWTRATDANTGGELEGGITSVKLGTVNIGRVFKQQTTPVTIGVSNIVWDEYNYVDDFLLYEYPDDGTVDISEETFHFFLPATTDLQQKEISDSFELPFFPLDNFADLPNQIEITDGYGAVTITANIDFSYDIDASYHGSGTPESRDDVFKLYYQINEDTPVLIDTFSINRVVPVGGPFDINISGVTTFNANLSDRIKIFIEVYLQINFDVNDGDWDSRKFYGGVTSETITIDFKSLADPTRAEGFFAHDVLAGIVERITGRSNSFYSEFFGSPYTKARQYDESGCGSAYTLHKGLQVRGYTLEQKKFFMSFKEAWSGLNPIFNLGCGYETIDGVEVIRIEPKEYFYNETPVLQMDYINNLEESFDGDVIAKSIIIGFEKWQSEDIRGLDDPQTKKTYATRMKLVGKEFSILSKFIAASLAWEVTRRKNIEMSADYKFDNDTFILAINTNTIASGLLAPELDENFSVVDNLDDSNTRYNLRLSCARIFGRWFSFFNGGIQDYVGSKYKFVSGEGNYDLLTTAGGSPPVCFGEHEFLLVGLSEKQDITVTTDHLFTHRIYATEKHPLSLAGYFEMRDNRTNAIQASTSDTDHANVFIKRLDFNPNKSTVKFIVRKR